APQGARLKLLQMYHFRAADEQHAHRPWPRWVKHIGHLQLVKWGDGGESSSEGRETIFLRDMGGRTVARITGHYAAVEWVGDLTGDGTPELVLHAWAGAT